MKRYFLNVGVYLSFSILSHAKVLSFANLDRGDLHAIDPKEITGNIFSKRTNKKIFCRLVLPPQAITPVGFLVLMHGLKSDSNYFNRFSYAESLVRENHLALLMCDHPGHGSSDGIRELISDFHSLNEQWAQIIDFFNGKNGKLPRLYGITQKGGTFPWMLGGHSMGGTIALSFIKDLREGALWDAAPNLYTDNTPEISARLPRGLILFAPALGQRGWKYLLDKIAGQSPAFLSKMAASISAFLNFNLPVFDEKFSSYAPFNEEIYNNPQIPKKGIFFIPWNIVFALTRRYTLDPRTAVEIARQSHQLTLNLGYLKGIPVKMISGLRDTWVSPSASESFSRSLNYPEGGANIDTRCEHTLIPRGYHDVLGETLFVIGKPGLSGLSYTRSFMKSLGFIE